MLKSPDIVRPAPLRFGVMCNGKEFQRWQADALAELMQRGHQPVLLIVNGVQGTEGTRITRFFRKKWSTVLFTALENRVFRPDAKRTVSLHRELSKAASMQCITERKGFSEFFSPGDIAAIRGYDLDFILRFGFGIIRGGILDAARHGVWSFHHDDEQKYRGGPAGFWEIFRNDPVNGAILQRLTEKLDAGVVLRKGYLKTVMHSYRENLEQLLSMSSSWPAAVADALSCGDIPGGCEPVPQDRTKAPVFRVPGNIRMLKFLFILLRNRVKFHYRDLLATEQWNIGIIRKPLHEVALSGMKLQAGDFAWLPPLKEPGYLADPAGFTVNGRLHILAEHYSYSARQAKIAEIDGDGTLPPRPVIDEGTHLSYPFVFDYRGEIYCVPESCRSNTVTLYRRDKASGEFTRVRTLLEGVGAVDPTLFQHDGRWWLFFTGRHWSNTHLYIYHADDLDDVFLPHRLNPVKTDVRSARPAGTPFVVNDILYRPAQDCSVTYGGRVAVNRVKRLSPDEFAEETIHHVEPAVDGRFNKGLHTLSGVGGLTLADGKRYVFDRRYFIGRLREKLTGKGTAHV